MRPSVRILLGDVRERLKGLPDQSVHCVVTSPPYWGLRDYGVEGQLGLEPTIDLYVEHMVEVFREVRRVLRKDGTLWLNMGDCYAGGKAGDDASAEGGHWNNGNARRGKAASYRRDKRPREDDPHKAAAGLKPKDLVMQPARVALALQADGWWVRQDVVWAKGISFCETYSGSCMPESCRDRPTSSHEYVFLMTKAARYFYDQEAVREGCSEKTNSRGPQYHKMEKTATPGKGIRQNESWEAATWGRVSSRNLRSVWAINPQAFPDAHFATFPERLVEPCIMAGTSQKGCCPECGAPWVREVAKERSFESGSGRSGNMPSGKSGSGLQGGGETRDVRRGPTLHTKTTGWLPSCQCHKPGTELPPGAPIPCTVLDPFMGSGTVGLVALRLGRSAIGIELNKEYAEMAERRIQGELGLLGEVGLA